MKDLESINKLIDSFSRFPSVGTKSAERFAFAFLNMSEYDKNNFINSLNEVKTKIHLCPICGSLTELNTCSICSDTDRTNDSLIIVAFPKDVNNFLKLENFKGKFHVLNGLISAIKGIGIDDLNINSLIERIKKDNTKEIILALDPTLEGEITSQYLAKILSEYNVEVTRLALGVPIGGKLDYIDSMTIQKAIEGRKKI